jgi:hypothetical protein
MLVVGNQDISPLNRRQKSHNVEMGLIRRPDGAFSGYFGTTRRLPAHQLELTPRQLHPVSAIRWERRRVIANRKKDQIPKSLSFPWEPMAPISQCAARSTES